ncbi:hypothetical protein IFM89_015695 [Coptis chinensis]|uniref:Uncharacterized protein n=1 Tax=Coptis chinensis TaxID=261450 RepID=A0A835ID47_9MAGN|nr:hypothetical protein IFM89_015695 [Coptis chinensis]
MSPLILFFLSSLCITLLPTTSSSATVLSAYDVLGSYGFPVGLLPQGITGYEIDQSGKFTAYLKGSCNVHIAGRHLKYKSTITGNISNDKLTDLVGVSVKVLLFWIGIDKVTVTGNDLYFKVGIYNADYSTDTFSLSPTCG